MDRYSPYDSKGVKLVIGPYFGFRGLDCGNTVGFWELSFKKCLTGFFVNCSRTGKSSERPGSFTSPVWISSASRSWEWSRCLRASRRWGAGGQFNRLGPFSGPLLGLIFWPFFALLNWERTCSSKYGRKSSPKCPKLEAYACILFRWLFGLFFRADFVAKKSYWIAPVFLPNRIMMIL